MKSLRSLMKFNLIILFIASVMLSCTKDQHPDPPKAATAKLSYFAKASVVAASAKKATLATDTATNTVAVNWFYATVWVEKITFTAEKKGLLDTTIAIGKNLNIFSADALAGVIQLPEGSYKDVKVKLFCRKSPKSEFAFDFKGTFTNTTTRAIDTITVGSSLPFEASLALTEITMNSADDYKVTLNFNLNNVLTGISAKSIESIARRYHNQRHYVIWKGGSADEPFYNKVIENWQRVASINISKGGVGIY